MATVSQNRDREQLEHDIQASTYQELLRQLQWEAPSLRAFSTWDDVVTFLRSGSLRDPRKDQILRPILRAHGRDNDSRWRSILLAMFWPALEWIHSRKRTWDPDTDERWQNITWAFLRVICRIDVTRRPERLAQKIVNDTVYHLREECRREWNRSKREIGIDLVDPKDLTDSYEIDVAGIELREEFEIEVNRLREHLEAGRISDADFLLLVGTRLYDQSVAEYARDAGLNYQAAKKRRQRAEAAIRRFEKEIP